MSFKSTSFNLRLSTIFRSVSTICVLVGLSSVQVFSQANIIDPNAANTPDISKCSGETELSALIQFISTGGNPAATTVTMPTGVEYIPGSVMMVSQTGGLAVAYASGPVNAPVFNITAGDGTINGGNEIRIKWRVKANCTTPTGTLDFPISVNFNGTSTGEVTADIIDADLNMTVHPIATASIGTPVTVPIVIQNGGLGVTDNITFKITESGMVTSAVTVGGFPATLISTMGTMKTYQVPVAALPGGSLNNPESITVLRTVTLTSCTFSSSYSTNWGCDGASCQTPAPAGPVAARWRAHRAPAGRH